MFILILIRGKQSILLLLIKSKNYLILNHCALANPEWRLRGRHASDAAGLAYACVAFPLLIAASSMGRELTTLKGESGVWNGAVGVRIILRENQPIAKTNILLFPIKTNKEIKNFISPLDYQF